jgi:hypothetical protein
MVENFCLITRLQELQAVALDVGAWEGVAHALSKAAGIDVPDAKLSARNRGCKLNIQFP